MSKSLAGKRTAAVSNGGGRRSGVLKNDDDGVDVVIDELCHTPKVIQPSKRSPRTNGGGVGSGTAGGERKGRRSNTATSANNKIIDGN